MQARLLFTTSAMPTALGSSFRITGACYLTMRIVVIQRTRITVGVTYPKRCVRNSASKIPMTLLPSLISTGITFRGRRSFSTSCSGPVSLDNWSADLRWTLLLL